MLRVCNKIVVAKFSKVFFLGGTEYAICEVNIRDQICRIITYLLNSYFFFLVSHYEAVE